MYWRAATLSAFVVLRFGGFFDLPFSNSSKNEHVRHSFFNVEEAGKVFLAKSSMPVRIARFRKVLFQTFSKVGRSDSRATIVPVSESTS